MKKWLLTTVLTFVGSWVFSQERIAVFPFEDMDKVFVRNEATLFYSQFTGELRNRISGRYTIVPREDYERLIKFEADFQLSVFSAKEKTAEMNKVLNGTQILSGKIARVNNAIQITVSLHAYPNLEVLRGGATLRVANTTELFDKIPELIQKMLEEMTGGRSSAIVPANFVLVEGGTFTMGSTEAGETPQHQVTVSSFYMSKYEVTRKNWQEVMGRRSNPTGDNLPVIVSWYDAIEYCNKLSLKEGLTPCYRGSGDNIMCDWNANGYRLPTEAEWEYAAKGGNKDFLIYLYSGSNNPSTVAWYADNSNKEIKPVGTKQPNSLGIYDMSGNVAEWCWDWYRNYFGFSQTNPRGPDSGYNRVVRGGGAGNSRGGITSTIRHDWYPPIHAIGIRVVRIIPAASIR